MSQPTKSACCQAAIPETLHHYLSRHTKEQIIDFAIRATPRNNGCIEFYIRPANVSGDTVDFWVTDCPLSGTDILGCGSSFATKEQMEKMVKYMREHGYPTWGKEHECAPRSVKPPEGCVIIKVEKGQRLPKGAMFFSEEDGKWVQSDSVVYWDDFIFAIPDADADAAEEAMNDMELGPSLTSPREAEGGAK